jgi:hypothetical protein
MAIEPARAILLIGGAAMVCLAGVVITVGLKRPAFRAFAALLAARGISTLLPQVSTDPAWLWTAIRVQPYFALASVPLILYCLYAFPRPGGQPPSPRAGWATVGAIALLAGIYALDHSLFHPVAAGDPASPALRAAAGIQYTGIGPLAVLASLTLPLMGLLALRFAIHYRQQPDQPGAATVLLVCAGFLVGSLFDGALRLVSLADLLDRSEGFPWLPLGAAWAILPATAIVPAALAWAVLATGRRTEKRPLHAMEGRILVLAFLALLSGLAKLLLPPEADPFGHPVALVLLGVFRLMMPVLVAYALLLDAVQSARRRVHEAMSWAIALGALVCIGGLAAAAASPWVESPGPRLVGIAAAALSGLAWRHLVRAGRAAVDWVLPTGMGGAAEVAAVAMATPLGTRPRR